MTKKRTEPEKVGVADGKIGSFSLDGETKALPREVGELVVFGLVRSTKKISEVLPTFHVYRAVISPDTHRIVEQDLSKQSYLLWEAQHMLEAGLTEEFDRLTDEKKRG